MIFEGPYSIVHTYSYIIIYHSLIHLEIIFDKVYITGLYHLLHLLINSWQYTCLFKKCLLEDGCLASIVASVKEHFSDTDVCSLEKVCEVTNLSY